MKAESLAYWMLLLVQNAIQTARASFQTYQAKSEI